MFLACLLVKTRVCISLFGLDIFILNDFLAFNAIGKCLFFSPSVNGLQTSEVHLVPDLFVCKSQLLDSCMFPSRPSLPPKDF